MDFCTSGVLHAFVPFSVLFYQLQKSEFDQAAPY